MLGLTRHSDNQQALVSALVAMRQSMESTAVNTPFEGTTMQWEQEKVTTALRKLEEPIMIDWVEGDVDVGQLPAVLMTESVQLVRVA
jgi:hypothetical protein